MEANKNVFAIGIAFTGGGAFSLDAKFGFTFLGEPHFVEGVLMFVVVVAAVALGLRRRCPGNDQPRKADPYLHGDFARRG